jgi:asparagine synthase (glutamine-hydrolysing)
MDCLFRHEGWSRHGPVTVRGRAFDGETVLSGEQLARRFADAVGLGDETDPTRLGAVAADVAGFYAAVVDPPEGDPCLVADGARSVPLYYSADGTVVSDDGEHVARATGAERDPVTASEFLLTRYVTGPDTVWRGVHSTQAGEVVRLADPPERRTYRAYWPVDRPSTSDPRAVLGRGFERALDRLLAVAGDRQVVVPLSGGYDSRLLVAGLVERGHPVTAFTFGRPGHPDVEVSREVAARLGVDWELVAYDPADWRAWYHGPGAALRDRAAGGDALPFVAAHPAVRRLLDAGRVPADALWCPGHTVATPGERLPLFAGESADTGRSFDCLPAVEADDDPASRERVDPTVDALVEHVLDSHYTLWEWTDPAFGATARERIRQGLLDGWTGNLDPETAAAAYERWEWRGRMTTFTTGDLRGYEAAGVDWWLPLWDPAYVRAWERLGVADRRGKRAHAALAVERYRRVADVPADRADVTDRTLSPVDRLCARARYTPARTATTTGTEWEPPFLAPRSAWRSPGSHPLAWYGAVDPALLNRLPEDRSLYALRTLAAIRGIDLSDPSAPVPTGSTVDLPTDDGIDN